MVNLRKTDTFQHSRGPIAPITLQYWLMTRPHTRSSEPDISAIASIAREFIAQQKPDLPTLRKSNSPEGKALRAYEAQRPVGVRAFAKIKVGDWLELRRMDGPNTMVFVTHVGGMKRTPAVQVAFVRQEKVRQATSQRVWQESVVAINSRHPRRIKGVPYALLATLAKAFATRTCSTRRDANAGTYVQLVLGDARALAWATVKHTVLTTMREAGFHGIVQAPHPKTGVPQWYAHGKDTNVRVRLAGTATTASIEVDFVPRNKSTFRRK